MVKIGILGTGFIHETYHMPALRELEDVEVVAVLGRTEARTVDFAKRWGIQKTYHGDRGLDEICKDPAVEIVDIGLPNFLHPEAAILAAENHKAVICEKPLGRDASEAKQMLDATKRYGVEHFYAENQIFMPKARYAKNLIRQGSLGRIVTVRAREAHSGPHSPWFTQKSASGGGVLLDMGCHTMELTRHLMGKRPVNLCAWTGTFLHKIDVEDTSVVMVRYEGGELAQCESSWSAKGGLDIRVEIFGTEGSVFLDLTRETGIRVFTSAPTGVTVEKADAAGGWAFPSIREHETYGFVEELKHFVECFRRGVTPIETFEDGWIVNSLVQCAYESAASRKWTNFNS
jgi:predicted dehydrogenase